ncbi:hypothetical protein [Thiobacillus sp.]|uniref:hypothetical protein n=1 Tax=Thiobacillus sp. TaxID=924 RepID=UPI00286E4B37|nr:hypothetical protein [Thiobacillus sp.]
MNTTTNLQEAVQLLSEGGVLTRLKDEAQAEKEVQRAGWLVRLAELEKRQAEDGVHFDKKRESLSQQIADLEGKLNAARAELRKLEAPNPVSIEKLRGKLRRLADPKIGAAIVQLSDLSEKARHKFSSGAHRVRTFRGVVRETTSNALQIADVMADCRRVQLELEAMQEAARPDDLDAVIAAKIDPIKQAVRKLHGL